MLTFSSLLARFLTFLPVYRNRKGRQLASFSVGWGTCRFKACSSNASRLMIRFSFATRRSTSLLVRRRVCESSPQANILYYDKKQPQTPPRGPRPRPRGRNSSRCLEFAADFVSRFICSFVANEFAPSAPRGGTFFACGVMGRGRRNFFTSLNKTQR